MDPRLIRLKVIILGRERAGKSTIFKRIKEEDYQKERFDQVPHEFCFKTIKNGQYKLYMNDQMTKDPMGYPPVGFYKGAHIILMVSRTSDSTGILHLQSDLERALKEAVPYKAQVIVVSNLDKSKPRTYVIEDLEAVAIKNGCMTIEVDLLEDVQSILMNKLEEAIEKLISTPD